MLMLKSKSILFKKVKLSMRILNLTILLATIDDLQTCKYRPVKLLRHWQLAVFNFKLHQAHRLNF